jgi:hypothetical protein
MSKFALIHTESRYVVQWQDHSKFNYADPQDGMALDPLPDEFEFPDAPTWKVDGAFVDVDPNPPPEPIKYVPSIITMRQCRLALLQAGHLSTVDAAIASLQGMNGEAARIEWEYAASVERKSALVQAMAGTLGLDEEALDDLFITAAKL